LKMREAHSHLSMRAVSAIISVFQGFVPQVSG